MYFDAIGAKTYDNYVWMAKFKMMDNEILLIRGVLLNET